MRRRAVGPELVPSLALAVLIACGSGTHEPRASGRRLPVYSGHSADLFDDRIEPGALGFQLGMLADSAGGPPSTDNLLRERTQVGDAVVRARVTTVTSHTENTGRGWQIGLTTLERLGGTSPVDQQFTLRIGAGDPSAGVLRAFESRLIGATFIAFVRQFGRPSGEIELHFHIARDEKAEVDAVHAAVLLGQVH